MMRGKCFIVLCMLCCSLLWVRQGHATAAYWQGLSVKERGVLVHSFINGFESGCIRMSDVLELSDKEFIKKQCIEFINNDVKTVEKTIILLDIAYKTPKYATIELNFLVEDALYAVSGRKSEADFWKSLDELLRLMQGSKKK